MANLKGSRTSVYAASFTDDYSRMLAKDPDRYPRTTIMGTAPSILANRLSWYFDLVGPSVHVDTACSSSLVALDLACQSLRNGDASMALVVGTNMILGPEASVLLSNGDFLSPDGRCYSFDDRANGYARGEAIVSMVVKPIRDAVRDGDMIRAVIRATGSNQDGRTPVISQPSAQRQVDLMRHVYQKAGLDLTPVRYVEAHGTGTRVGDPIEMEALGRVFGPYRSAAEPLYVGSVKANIGHCEGSAGLAGVLKAILVLERGIIPPNALFQRLNPDIDAERYHLAVPVESTVWPNQGLRRVSVNSFGFGGTNAHAVLDDAFHYLKASGLEGNHRTVSFPTSLGVGKPSTNGSGCGRTNGVGGQLTNGHHDSSQAINGASGKVHDESIEALPLDYRLLIFSAPDEKSLRRVVQGYKPYYKEHIQGSSSGLSQLAFTLAARRTHHLWRTCAVVGNAGTTPVAGAGDAGDGGDAAGLVVGKLTRASSTDRKLVFVFTGQGAQYSRMGLGLLCYPVFRQTLDEVDKALGQLGCKWRVVDQIRCESTIHLPEYSQPLCTALQIALVELLRSLGVVPRVAIGHSSGEIAAAYTTGALSLASACKVAYFRGQLAGQARRTATKKSAMASVNLAAEQIPRYLQQMGPEVSCSVTVACINSPANSTLSGPQDAIQAVQRQLDQDGIFARILDIGVAYHSPAMQSVAKEYLELMNQLEPRTTSDADTMPPAMFSSVTGGQVANKLLLNPQYWVDNLVSPVRFSEALCSASSSVGDAVLDLVEVGPHSALRRPIQETLMAVGSGGGPEDVNTRYGSALVKGKNACDTIQETVGRLFCGGHPVSVQAANQQQQQNPLTAGGQHRPLAFRNDCPPFPFDHSQGYWAEPRLSRDFRLREPVPRSSLGARYQHWNPLEPTWRQLMCVEAMPWVKDHEVRQFEKFRSHVAKFPRQVEKLGNGPSIQLLTPAAPATSMLGHGQGPLPRGGNARHGARGSKADVPQGQETVWHPHQRSQIRKRDSIARKVGREHRGFYANSADKPGFRKAECAV